MRMTLGALLACAALGGICPAADVEAAIRRPTQIPPQPLAPALQRLVKERNIQLVYRAELIREHRTSGASGNLTALEALSQLLNGTGLTYKYLDAETLTILPLVSPTTASEWIFRVPSVSHEHDTRPSATPYLVWPMVMCSRSVDCGAVVTRPVVTAAPAFFSRADLVAIPQLWGQSE